MFRDEHHFRGILRFYADSSRVIRIATLFQSISSMKETDELKLIIPKVMDSVRYSIAASSQDIGFFKTMDSHIDVVTSKSAEMLLDLIERLTHREFDKKNGTGTYHTSFLWEKIENFLDSILENIDIAAERHVLKVATCSSAPRNHLEFKKPQESFTDKIDNSDDHPFVPKLTRKPHFLQPFASLVTPDHLGLYSQPYEYEIMKQPYPESIFISRTPIQPVDWDSRPAISVNTTTGLRKMVDALRSSQEIAVDLEHHDLRSYYGITCLMQISSRSQDWLLDVLALRADLEILNEIFTNPKIVKVFHGAFMDIIWLQRDFGLYIVSLFDTYHASTALGFPKRSLAYLLDRFVGFKASKKFQLADWRVRPLPKAMEHYARADTHYLLYIFDHLRNSLLEEGNQKLQEVLFLSRKVALRKFEYAKFRRESGEFSDEATAIMRNYNVPEKFKNRLKSVIDWRDQKARELDESTRYIMNNSILLKIAVGGVDPKLLQQEIHLDGNDLNSLSALLKATSVLSQDSHSIVEDEASRTQSTSNSITQRMSAQSVLLTPGHDLLLHESSLLSREVAKKEKVFDRQIYHRGSVSFHLPFMEITFQEKRSETPSEHGENDSKIEQETKDDRNPAETDIRYTNLRGEVLHGLLKVMRDHSKSENGNEALDYEKAIKEMQTTRTKKRETSNLQSKRENTDNRRDFKKRRVFKGRSRAFH